MIHERKREEEREGEQANGRRGKTSVAVYDVFRSANFIQPSRLHPSAPTIAIIFLGFCEKNTQSLQTGGKKKYCVARALKTRAGGWIECAPFSLGWFLTCYAVVDVGSRLRIFSTVLLSEKPWFRFVSLLRFHANPFLTGLKRRRISLVTYVT